MKLDLLLGLQKETAIDILEGRNMPYILSYTKSPKGIEGFEEERILRAKLSDDKIELIAGYF